MAAPNQLLSNLPEIKFIPFSINFDVVTKYGLIFLLIVVSLVLVLALRKHRIRVEFYEQVKGGYVVHSGRFGVYYDKNNKLAYLKKMFGKLTIPSFDYKYYQKNKGGFLGVNRILTLIKMNEHSYKPMLPTMDYSGSGEVFNVNTLSWLFIKERNIFLDEIKKQKLMEFLSIAAPAVIIIGSFIFFGVTIYMQRSLTQLEAEQIKAAFQAYISSLK